jgi:DNA-directed RNA polymerase subunit RPC12/RpoP
VSGLYVRSTIACPACGGPLTLTLRVGAIEELEARGISEAEQLQAVEKGLLSRRIVCPHCQVARQN